MKKRLLACILVFVMLFPCLAGCGGPNTEATLKSETDKIMKGIQAFDDSTLATLKAVSGDQEESTEESSDLSNFEDYQSIMNYLKEAASKMTYEITSVDVENLTVDVSCTYVDATEFAQNLYTNLLAWAFSNMFSGEEISDEEVQSLIDTSLAAVTEDKTKDANITFTFEEKDKGYQIKEIPEELYDAATAGIYSAFSGLNDSFEEQEEEEQNYEDAKENITYNVTKTKMGSVIEATNNNDVEIDVDFSIIYKDKDGKMLSETTESIKSMLPGETYMTGTYTSTASFESVDVQVSTSKPYTTRITDITLEDNDSDHNVIMKYTNNGEKTIEYIDVDVIFYKGDKIVGFSDEMGSDVEPGKYVSLTANGPYNIDSFEDIEFDSYKVYATAYAYAE